VAIFFAWWRDNDDEADASDVDDVELTLSGRFRSSSDDAKDDECNRSMVPPAAVGNRKRIDSPSEGTSFDLSLLEF
jgi:hypothetical protein